MRLFIPWDVEEESLEEECEAHPLVVLVISNFFGEVFCSRCSNTRVGFWIL
jgi:hypothetical protein